jgi:hypothetical protein
MSADRRLAERIREKSSRLRRCLLFALCCYAAAARRHCEPPNFGGSRRPAASTSAISKQTASGPLWPSIGPPTRSPAATVTRRPESKFNQSYSRSRFAQSARLVAPVSRAAIVSHCPVAGDGVSRPRRRPAARLALWHCPRKSARPARGFVPSSPSARRRRLKSKPVHDRKRAAAALVHSSFARESGRAQRLASLSHSRSLDWPTGRPPVDALPVFVRHRG